jgi:hypothetical protein
MTPTPDLRPLASGKTCAAQRSARPGGNRRPGSGRHAAAPAQPPVPPGQAHPAPAPSLSGNPTQRTATRRHDQGHLRLCLTPRQKRRLRHAGPRLPGLTAGGLAGGRGAAASPIPIPRLPHLSRRICWRCSTTATECSPDCVLGGSEPGGLTGGLRTDPHPRLAGARATDAATAIRRLAG